MIELGLDLDLDLTGQTCDLSLFGRPATGELDNTVNSRVYICKIDRSGTLATGCSQLVPPTNKNMLSSLFFSLTNFRFFRF